MIEINKVVNDVFAWQIGPNSLSVAIKQHIDVLADSGMTDGDIYRAMLPVFDLLYLTQGGSQKSMISEAPLNTVETAILKVINNGTLEIPQDKMNALEQSSFAQEQLKRSLLIEPPNTNNTAASLRLLSIKILNTST